MTGDKKLPRVETLADGEDWRMQRGKSQYWLCCDCLLAHEVYLVEADDGKAVVRLVKRPRLTAAYRRKAKK